jgi:hypothetical protein
MILNHDAVSACGGSSIFDFQTPSIVKAASTELPDAGFAPVARALSFPADGRHGARKFKNHGFL